jgi:lysophospholipase L1-like esterase
MTIRSVITVGLAVLCLSPQLNTKLIAQNQEQSQEASRFEIPESDEGLPGAGPLRRYGWFKNLWKSKRTQWAEQVEQDQGAVVFYGDSITQGWGDNMGNSFPGLKVANRGISGDTTRGLLVRLEEDVLKLNPSGVVLLIGTNDLEEGASPEVIASNMKILLDALKKHNPDLPVILCKVFPSSASKRRPADQIKKINELYQGLAHKQDQITLLETWLLFANASGDSKVEEFPDLLHPNQAGYAKWAAALRPIFATLQWTETEPDDFKIEPGFQSLFNGKDLSGWTVRNWDDLAVVEDLCGKTVSSDGRYVALNGRIVVKTPSEYRRVQQLWSAREFPCNFTLKLEFRATPYADSGVFIRKPQLQCRDYPLAGPYKDLKNYKPQEWNELVIEVRDNVATGTCNGEILESAMQLPSNGPIGLEGDRGQMEYRRIRIKPLAP